MRQILFIFLLNLIFLEPAQAHRLNVFAWPENDKVMVESNFGKNRPARNAQIEIKDAVSDLILLHGTTDDNGKFSFPRPDKEISSLLITVNGGQGHQGFWRLDLQPIHPDGLAASTPAKDYKQNFSVTETQLRNIIREELQSVYQNQFFRPEMEPGLKEILGGLGWIIGLTGIFLWWKSQHNK